MTADTPVVFRPAYLRHVGAYYGIRPAVEEVDRGRVWIVTQDQRFLRTVGIAALPGEVRRRLPGIAAQRGFEVDLEVLERQLSREHALAIGIDDRGITILTPEGRTHEAGHPRSAGHGVGSDSVFCNALSTFFVFFGSFFDFPTAATIHWEAGNR